MPTQTSENNKRIAKNTLILYMRTFITMCVSLYTGRVMLQALGVDNYGINNVVGGIVGMSSIITSTMAAAISRYITYAIGEGDTEKQKTVFSTSVNVQIIMAAIAIVILEVVGVWFLNTQASIPDGRMDAANWVLQCSVFTMAVGLIGVPFTAVIIAYERMGVYAYMGIADVVTKLILCFSIQAYGGDRLILFSILLAIASTLMTLFYCFYCFKHFKEARFRRVFDLKLLKEMSSYAGWNLFGSSAWAFNTQGVNMLVNVFYGVVFNASRGVANTFNSAIQKFVNDFTTAFSPQITKSFASGNIDYMVQLAIRGTKFTWLLMYIFIVPVCLEADTLLQLWLVDVPPLAGVFLRLTMFESLAVQSGSTILKVIQAQGNIRRYQIEVTAWGCSVFPLAWIAFKLGAPVWSPYVIFIVVYFLLNIVRFYTLRRLMRFPVRRFLREGILPCLWVSVLAFTLPCIVAWWIPSGILHFFVVSPIAVLWTAFCCYQWGFNAGEREFLRERIVMLKNKIKR